MSLGRLVCWLMLDGSGWGCLCLSALQPSCRPAGKYSLETHTPVADPGARSARQQMACLLQESKECQQQLCCSGVSVRTGQPIGGP